VGWADYNGDGFLDLYVGHLSRGFNPGNLLYRNNRDGTFTNVAASAGVADLRDSNGGVAWADYDNDGDQDVYVGNRHEPNGLFRQGSDGRFDDVAPAAGVANEGNSSGIAWGDYDNDGWLDLFVANQDRQSSLYRNSRDGTFADVTAAAGLALPGASVGANWADFDNDGWLDLLVVNLGNSAPNRLYHNNGDGTFSDVAASVGLAYQENGRTAAWADIDNDGFLDLAVSNYGTTRLFRNAGNGNHWLNVRLSGTVSNRDAIGARIEARAVINGRLVRQTREVSAGGSRHSQDSVDVEFGLGDAPTVDLSITFPSGLRQQLTAVAADRWIRVHEAGPDARIHIDTPAGGSTSQPFQMAGWALDLASLGGSGIDAVHVWAYPSNGGPPAFVGSAAYGDARPDVGAAFGSRFTSSGFHLGITGLAPGEYDLVAYPHSTISGTFEAGTVVRTTLGTGIAMNVDIPGSTANVQTRFTVAGWAVDRSASAGPGVDAVHVYAYPESGPGVFLGAAVYGLARPDVGAVFGAQFTDSGFSLAVPRLQQGRYRLVVFARSRVSKAFEISQTIDVTVKSNAIMNIDIPANNATVSIPFRIGGWAIDLGAASGSGVDVVHAYAYHADGPPVFLGAPAYGGLRSDVAAAFGSRFASSGFGMTAAGLVPGRYTIVVYGRSTVTGNFDVAQTVVVTIE
jgi:hypothetical protein